MTLRFQLLRRQTNGSNFRVRKSGAGVERFFFADGQEREGDPLHHATSLRIGRMREGRCGRHIPDGINAFDGRRSKTVDLDPAPVILDPGLLQSKRIDIAHPADRNQNLVHIPDLDFIVP